MPNRLAPFTRSDLPAKAFGAAKVGGFGETAKGFNTGVANLAKIRKKVNWGLE
jgi:hypothetical protein